MTYKFNHIIESKPFRGLLILLLFSMNCFGQQSGTVDFIGIDAILELDKNESSVKGTFNCTFQVLQATDRVYLDAIDMEIMVPPSGDFEIYSEDNKIFIKGNFVPGKEYMCSFGYKASPRQALYFVGDQIWTQGQGKYTSHWLPSLDDMNDKIEFDLTFLIDKGSTVIGNGSLSRDKDFENYEVWRYNMEHPMSSYLVAFVVGDFNKTKLTSTSGVPIELYYRPEDSLKAEPTYRYSKEIFDFLETEIGVAYPWQNYKQVPVRDFLYAGMENTTTTIFSEAFVVDSIGFNDRNYINVNAHELAHQWFGNLVTETDGRHHWLHEGFATYYALLAEKEIFGIDYYYWKLLQSAEQLDLLSGEGKGESLLDPKASSLTFYEKGAWALHMLKELIGEETFKVAIKNYLVKHQFRNVTTSDFLNEVRAASSVDISQWEADWLQQTAFKAKQALESLRKSEFINDYFKASVLRTVPFEDKKETLESLLSFSNDYVGQEVLYQLANEPIEKTMALYKKAFESGNLMIRQDIVLSIPQIPSELKSEFESLLKDPSYETRQYALSALWETFPEERLNYLEQMKYVEGFQNKNIKLLWLVMAISSEVYGASATEIFISELQSYTSNFYSFEVREQAFGYLSFDLKLMDDAVLENLVNATVHHNWRFRNYARQTLDQLLEIEAFQGRLARLLERIPEKDARYLRSKIKKE